MTEDQNKLKRGFITFATGFLFAVGLAVSQMTEPTKIFGFLNLRGPWDPSLMFVMMGAIGVHFFAYRYAFKIKKPILDAKLKLPEQKIITPNLIIGAVIFGLGWAYSGYCPGGGMVAAVSGDWGAIAFVIAIIVGMIAHHFLSPLWLKPKSLVGED